MKIGKYTIIYNLRLYAICLLTEYIPIIYNCQKYYIGRIKEIFYTRLNKHSFVFSDHLTNFDNAQVYGVNRIIEEKKKKCVQE